MRWRMLQEAEEDFLKRMQWEKLRMAVEAFQKFLRGMPRVSPPDDYKEWRSPRYLECNPLAFRLIHFIDDGVRLEVTKCVQIL